jgi:hypothetical protein
LKRSSAVRPQLYPDTQFPHDVDRIAQFLFAGCIGDQNPGSVLMQKTGGGKSGAAEADNENVFIF